MAELAKTFAGEGVDPRYAGYFALFNQQKFYEAHDILEDLWLPDRHGVNGSFYKGLIQLAGAFVHLQKQRLRLSDRPWSWNVCNPLDWLAIVTVILTGNRDHNVTLE